MCLVVSQREISANAQLYYKHTFQVVGITETRILLWINLLSTSTHREFDKRVKERFHTDNLCEEFARKSSPYVKEKVKDQTEPSTLSKATDIDRHIRSQNVASSVALSITDAIYNKSVALLKDLVQLRFDTKGYKYASVCNRVEQLNDLKIDPSAIMYVFSVVVHPSEYHVWMLVSGTNKSTPSDNGVCESLSIMSDVKLDELRNTYSMHHSMDVVLKCYYVIAENILHTKGGYMEILAYTENKLEKKMILMASARFSKSNTYSKQVKYLQNISESICNAAFVTSSDNERNQLIHAPLASPQGFCNTIVAKNLLHCRRCLILLKKGTIFTKGIRLEEGKFEVCSRMEKVVLMEECVSYCTIPKDAGQHSLLLPKYVTENAFQALLIDHSPLLRTKGSVKRAKSNTKGSSKKLLPASHNKTPRSDTFPETDVNMSNGTLGETSKAKEGHLHVTEKRRRTPLQEKAAQRTRRKTVSTSPNKWTYKQGSNINPLYTMTPATSNRRTVGDKGAAAPRVPANPLREETDNVLDNQPADPHTVATLQPVTFHLFGQTISSFIPDDKTPDIQSTRGTL